MRKDAIIGFCILIIIVLGVGVFADSPTYYYDNEWHDDNPGNKAELISQGGESSFIITDTQNRKSYSHNLRPENVEIARSDGIELGRLIIQPSNNAQGSPPDSTQRSGRSSPTPLGISTTTWGFIDANGNARTQRLSVDESGRPIAIHIPDNRPQRIPPGFDIDFTDFSKFTLPSTSSANTPAYFPLEGGGRIAALNKEGTHHRIHDENNRVTEITRPSGVHVTIDYDGDTTTRTNYQYGLVGSTTRVSISQEDHTMIASRLGSGSEAPLDAFFRSTIEAGITELRLDKNIKTVGAHDLRVTQGDTVVMTSGDRVVTLQGPASLGDGDYTSIAIQNADGTITEYSGKGLQNTFANRETGVIDENALNLAFGESSTIVRRRTLGDDGTRIVEVETIRKDTIGGLHSDKSIYNPSTGSIQYGFENGKYTRESWHGIPPGLTFGEKDNTLTSDEMLDLIRRQEGVNVDIVTFDKSGTFLVDGEWKAFDKKSGTLRDCDSSDDCVGTDDERSQFVKNVLNKQAEHDNNPNTRKYQERGVIGTVFKTLGELFEYSNELQGFAGYSSLLITSENGAFLKAWKSKVNQAFCDAWLLEDCWESEVCAATVKFHEPVGTLIGSTPDGRPRSIAHIEGEKSTPILLQGVSRNDLVDLFGSREVIIQGLPYDLTNENVDLSSLPPIEVRIYKVTLSFSPETRTSMNVQFKGSRTVDWFSPAQEVAGGAIYSRQRSNPIVFTSATNYDEVCITFDPEIKSATRNNFFNEQCTRLVELTTPTPFGMTPETAEEIAVGGPTGTPQRPEEGQNA